MSEKPKELRPDGPRVTLELHLDRLQGWTPPKELDASSLGDDRYVADVLAFRDATGSKDCALLTADTGPLGKAKRHGLRAVSTMLPGWELPEEPDTRDKQIRQLQKELEDTRQSGPSIEATTTVDGKPVKEITVEVVRYPVLPDTMVSEMLKELKRLHPRVTEFPHPVEDGGKMEPVRTGRGFDLASIAAPYDWVGPTGEQVASYLAAYDKWLAEARELMETVPTSRQEAEFETVFELALANVGAEAAEDVWVSFAATAGLVLRDQRKEDTDSEDDGRSVKAVTARRHALRAAPTAPSWKKVYREVAPPNLPDGAERVALLKYGVLADHLKTANLIGGLCTDDLLKKWQGSGVLADHLKTANLIGGLGADVFRGMFAVDRGNLFGDTPAFTGARAWIDDVAPLLIPTPQPRDPEAFYWKNRPSGSHSETWEFKCSLLRHHIEPKSWVVPVVARLDALPPNGGSVKVKVHARNMRRPFDISFPVKIVFRDNDTESLVRALLPPGMHRQFQQT